MDIKLGIVLLVFSLCMEHLIIFHVANAYSMPAVIAQQIAQ